MKRLLVAAALIVASGASSQDRPIAIVDATILTGAGESIENGTLVYRQGKIEAVGRNVDVPGEAERINAEGLFLTPGFIDAHSGFGLRGGGWDRENLSVPDRDLLQSFAPPTDPPWLRSGVTTTYIGPSGQNLLGGLGAIVKLTGRIVRSRAALHASFGETALDAFEAPTTRQGMIAVLRQTFIRSQEDALVGEGGRAVASALAKDIPLRIRVNTRDDILTAIRLAKEFDAQLVVESAVGGHEVASAIATAGVPVIVGPSIIGIGNGGPYEGFAHTPANAAELHAAGVTIALGTFSGRGRSVAMEGVMVKSHGLTEEATLRALTLDAATILGVGDRLGSLEIGKDADLVLWEGRPLSTWGRTKRVIVDGRTVFSR